VGTGLIIRDNSGLCPPAGKQANFLTNLAYNWDLEKKPTRKENTCLTK